MSSWLPWSAESFARARERRAPVLAAVGPAPELGGEAWSLVQSSFVPVLVDAESRPDAAARLGAGRLVVLGYDGSFLAEVPLGGGLTAALGRLASAGAGAREETPGGAVWTGAVADRPAARAPGSEEVAAALRAAGGAVRAEAVEALLHAAAERGDAAALAAAEAALDAARPATLAERARWSRLQWEAFALTGTEARRRAAAASAEELLKSHYDAARGAFARERGAASSFPADGNALAVYALLKARAFGHAGAGEAAEKSLAFLQSRLYDPLLGFLHAHGGGDEVYGLLGDAAWASLAATEAYLATGLKSHREFADAVLRYLFQELWEREGGGFLDRVHRPGDPEILRRPRLDPALNAAALEACRRLHHLKGVANYKRWLEWGLAGVWAASAEDPAARAAVARVADLNALGRMDLELIGRPGEPKTTALLDAVHRLHLPRLVVSFVDPDDQDYILAHRLEADRYPRLFACGPDLKRVADTDDPAGVPALIESLRKVR